MKWAILFSKNIAFIALFAVLLRAFPNPFEQVLIALLGLIYLNGLENSVKIETSARKVINRLYSRSIELAEQFNNSELSQKLKLEQNKTLDLHTTEKLYKLVNLSSCLLLKAFCLCTLVFCLSKQLQVQG